MEDIPPADPIMDYAAQRFDPNRRPDRLAVKVSCSKSRLSHSDVDDTSSPPNSPSSPRLPPRISCPWNDYGPYILPIAVVPHAPATSDMSETSSGSSESSLASTSNEPSPQSAAPPSVSVGLDDVVRPKDSLQIDSHPVDEFTTIIRTIIRPTSPIHGCIRLTNPFSRPSSPSPLTRSSSPNPTSRPSSPFSHLTSTSFKNLNCIGSKSEAFELDVDLMQMRRPEIQVVISRESNVELGIGRNGSHCENSSEGNSDAGGDAEVSMRAECGETILGESTLD